MRAMKLTASFCLFVRFLSFSRSASRSPRARQRSPATGNVNTKAQQESARMGFFNTNKSFKVADSTEKE